MNTLDRIFARPEPALVTYLCAGDPTPEASAEMLAALVAGGADVIEIGVPFSDPGADGPAIQRASERALAAGTTLDHALDLAAGIPDHVGKVLFGYLNPFLRYGYERLAKRCAEVGVSGLLCVDCPPEEEPELADALASRGVHTIRLIAPTTPDERLAGIAHRAGGFLYYVSMTGVTGAAFAGDDALVRRVQRVKELSGLPIAVGFGIATPDDAKLVARAADGVVVGSALVRLVAEHGAEAAPHVEALTRSLKQALKE
ncbi:MAG: tryptophan synthase subunit alpha [Alphaproteobacteria bacterium]|nr:tryptophan synthase subunit alpha [Alphaproteobacteria bacterium]MCB9794400.1 tryptophan synthase subunit alpha [Alphaproteobacteria bacterium]